MTELSISRVIPYICTSNKYGTIAFHLADFGKVVYTGAYGTYRYR